MEEDTVDPHAVHRRFELAPDLPTLPDAADDELAAGFDALDDLRHGTTDVLLRQGIRLVQRLQIRQRLSFRRDDVQGRRQRLVGSIIVLLLPLSVRGMIGVLLERGDIFKHHGVVQTVRQG